MIRRTTTLAALLLLVTDLAGSSSGSGDLGSNHLRIIQTSDATDERDVKILVADTTTGDQIWMSRMDVCGTDGGRELVLDAYKWRRGVQPNPATCCVSASGEDQCLIVTKDNAEDMKEPHLQEGVVTIDEQDVSKKIFVGIRSTWFACPDGFVPLVFKGPFGADDTCCSFYKGDDPPSSDPQPCGAGFCKSALSLRDVAFCDAKAPEGARKKAVKILEDVFSGPVTDEKTEDDEHVCYDATIASETNVTKAEELCETKNTERKEAEKGYCAFCRRTGSEGQIEKKCTDCSRTVRANRAGWSCRSFAPEYPCGGGSLEIKFRHFQDKSDFPSHPQQIPLDALSPVEDFNDGRYRQDGPAARTSPLRPGLRYRRQRNRKNADARNRRVVEASGSCPHLTGLHLESSRDEPLHATAEDFASDRLRLEEIMAGLGIQSGLGELKSVLYPRVSATADLSDPSKVAVFDASQHHFSCSDSMSTEGIVGTPGGDVAEFILAMNVLEKARGASGETLSDEHVMYYFQEFLERMPLLTGKRLFFMCVDEPSLTRWAEASQVADPTMPRGVGEIARLVDYGVMRKHLGSAHLRAMVKDPEAYRCREGLVKAVVRAFLTVYYDATHPSRGRLVIGTYEGDYPRETLLYVNRQQGYRCGNMSPLVVPVSIESTSREIFVVHRSAVDVYRERLARFVNEKLGYNPTSEASIFQSMRDLGEMQLQTTVDKLLPRGTIPYIANFMTNRE